MRVLLLVAVLTLSTPARGQDDAATNETLKALFTRRGEIQMALLCKYRDAAWYATLAMTNLNAAQTIARLNSRSFGGTDSLATAFVHGGDSAAAASADAEFKRYGLLACERLVASGHLPVLDRAVR